MFWPQLVNDKLKVPSFCRFSPSLFPQREQQHCEPEIAAQFFFFSKYPFKDIIYLLLFTHELAGFINGKASEKFWQSCCCGAGVERE